jgi:hypothetical protein
MPRGGIHKNTLKPNWNAGKTTTVRVPIVKKTEILALAKAMDLMEGEAIAMEKDSLLKAVLILKDCLSLPANKGGAIKVKIRDVLALIDPCL